MTSRDDVGNLCSMLVDGEVRGDAFRHVLLVDDNVEVLRAFKRGLGGGEYIVYACTHAEAARARFGVRPPDFAVIDLSLRDGPMEGLSLLAWISDRHPSTRCALVTGNLDVQVALDAASAGARVIAEKPASPCEVLRALERGPARTTWLGASSRVRRATPCTVTDEEDSPALSLDAAGRRHAATALERSGGNKAQAARLLGVSRSHLYALLKERDPD